MSSIIEGYNYDIFVSYRQKDNKGEGWVSEFVEALVTELESTFKEEVTVYFDINPHDGLLETHDVNDSLKEKIKCLVFIPIISRTYCDPNSFAWKHEFIAFLEQAATDKYGIKVKLPHGNVGTRVLPVRIHELDTTDLQLCENVMGGPLRGVDFIYKTTGVNRPLRINEDNPRENLNHTYYRDQINKVANAIREITDGLSFYGSIPGQGRNEEKKEPPGAEMKYSRRFKGLLVLKIILPLIIVAAGIIAVIFSGGKLKNSQSTVAMMPLTIIGDEELVKDASSFAEMIIDKLRLINGVAIVPRISMLQFKDTEKPIAVISKELNADYFIDGNIRREENKTIIWIELSTARDNKSLWSDRYAWDKESIPMITREILRNVAGKLDLKLTPEELKQIDNSFPGNPEANLNYISANAIINEAAFFEIYGNRLRDSTDLISAISSYDKAIELDSSFAEAYARRSIAISWYIYTQQLDSSYISQCRADAEKSLELRKSLHEGQVAMGFYYYYCRKNAMLKALEHFRTAAELSPFDYHPKYYMSLVYRRMGDWTSSQKLIAQVIKQNPTEAIFLTNIGISYQYLHDYDSAIIFHQKAVDIMPAWPDASLNKMYSILLRDGQTNKAWPVMNAITDNSSKTAGEYKIKLLTMDRDYQKALQEVEKLLSGPSDKFLYKAAIHTSLNNSAAAQMHYDSAIVSLNKELTTNSDHPQIHMNLASSFAGKGNSKKAIEEGNKAIELATATGNNMIINDMKLNYLEVLIDVGEYEEAVELADYLLENPSMLSLKLLEHDPVFDPLRKRQDFKDIIKEHSLN